jgi:hypothetical protein
MRGVRVDSRKTSLESAKVPLDFGLAGGSSLGLQLGRRT